MKKLFLLVLGLSLALTLCCGFVACSSEDGPDTTVASDTTEQVPNADATETPTEDASEVPTEAPTEDASEVPTEAPTEAPVETTEAPAEETTAEPETQATVEITDGMMLYYEDFSSYGDVADNQAALDALGWKIQTVADDYAYSDWTASVAIQNGALNIINYNATEGFKGKDSYALMLGEEYMRPIAQYGDYTLQYDVTYTDANNYKRYICLLTDYFGDSYNSYHFRIGGYANNQGHLLGEWITYDTIDPAQDLSAKLTANSPEQGTTIAYKLLGIETEIKDATAIENFRNVTVTIRIQHDADLGNIIYMKTAEMTEFICVSMPRADATGAADWPVIQGAPGLAFKVGGAINGTMDNIAMWAGLGEMPADTTVTYPLAK